MTEGDFYATCWFDQKDKAVASHAYPLGLHRNVQSRQVVGGTLVAWNQRTLMIPRCAACRKSHARRQRRNRIVGSLIITILLITLVLLFVFGLNWFGLAFLFFGTWTALWVMLAYFASPGITRREAKSLRTFQPLKEQIDAGWSAPGTSGWSVPLI